MKTIRLIIGISLVMVFVFPAWAVQRTFVSGTGNDANACSVTAPCRTFAVAISYTDAGGEVIGLDSAGYGSVTINKSVSIIAPSGVYAGISVFSGNGITINAGSPDVIVLRGLSINGLGGVNGIVFNTGAALYVETCVVSGVTNEGIHFGAAGNLIVKDSVFRNNGGNGIFISSSSGTATASIDHVLLKGSFFGLAVGNGGKATVTNSVASHNDTGFDANATGALSTAEINIESCMVANNQDYGIVAEGYSGGVATVRISNSIVTDNGTGLSQSGSGVLESRGNNTVRGNTTDTSGSITTISGM